MFKVVKKKKKEKEINIKSSTEKSFRNPIRSFVRKLLTKLIF
jgi:citrate lyase gamma subunit